MITTLNVAEFDRIEDYYLKKYNAYILESTELYVTILYGRTLQYKITIRRPRKYE